MTRRTSPNDETPSPQPAADASGLARWVRGFAGKRVLLVGDLILDRYLYGDAERISPEAPVPVLRTVEKRDAMGGSANVAACLQALGCQAVCCGVIGDDRDGDRLVKLLQDVGIDTSGIVKIAHRPTTVKTRLVGLAQHRHRQQLLRVDEEDTSPLSNDVSKQLFDVIARTLANVDVVCIEDYDKGVITAELAAHATEKAHRLGRKVLVDPARLKDYSRYRGVDILTPNRDELSIVAGRRFESLDAVPEAASKVLRAIGANSMVVTVDRDGSIVAEKDGSHKHLPTTPRSVYDNTGAGDAVLAMLAAAVASGADLESAARLANVAGGLEVEKFGCVPITADEVLADLRLADRIRNGKTRTVAELLPELALRRDRGEIIAFTNGCFDILHAGHVDYLQRCRREASVLVVGVNDDSSVKAQNKGSDRPINTLRDRATVLGALECVDYVVSFSEPDPENLIRQVRPDLLIKGEDWTSRGVKGREFVESYGGRVVLLPLVEGLSTTALVARIRGGKS